MDFSDSIQLCTERLEGILSREFGGSGRDLGDRLEHADIPDGLREDLREIARRAARDDTREDGWAAMQLVFLCGQVYERLETLSAIRVAEPLTYVEADGTPSPALDNGDVASVAEIAQAWRQFLAKVADFVLKLLLVTVVVVFIGLLIGLI